MRFHKLYFLVAVALFIIEVLIAAFVHDRYVRPYVGDFLVVIFLYALVKAFIPIRPVPAALGVLLFAYIVEFLQYHNLVAHLGWKHSRLANIILGNSFEWIDMLAYTLGIGVVLWAERRRK